MPHLLSDWKLPSHMLFTPSTVCIDFISWWFHHLSSTTSHILILHSTFIENLWRSKDNLCQVDDVCSTVSFLYQLLWCSHSRRQSGDAGNSHLQKPYVIPKNLILPYPFITLSSRKWFFDHCVVRSESVIEKTKNKNAFELIKNLAITVHASKMKSQVSFLLLSISHTYVVGNWKARFTAYVFYALTVIELAYLLRLRRKQIKFSKVRFTLFGQLMSFWKMVAVPTTCRSWPTFFDLELHANDISFE